MISLLAAALAFAPASTDPSVRQLAGAPGNPFNEPAAMALVGSSLFILDGNAIERFDIATATYSTFAGERASPGAADGTGADARFDEPRGIATDGTDLYVADTDNHTIRKVVVATAAVSTIAGLAGSPGADDGVGAAARFRHPWGVAAANGVLWVMDRENFTVRRVDVATAGVTTAAGVAGVPGFADGVGAAARTFSRPTAVVAGAGVLWLTDGVGVRRMSTSSARVTTIASLREPHLATDPTGIALAGDNLYVAAIFDDHDDTVLTGIKSVSIPSRVVSDFTMPLYRDATALTTDAASTTLYVTGFGEFYPSLYQTVIASSASTDLAPFGARGFVDGAGTVARFDFPAAVATDGKNLYVVDEANRAVRRVRVATGTVDTLTTGLGFFATGITLAGGDLYVADGSRIDKVSIATGHLTTVATFGSSLVNDVAVAGNNLYAVVNNCALYRVPLATGTPAVFAGAAGSCGSADGVGTAARFGADATCPACPPQGISTDGATLYVADHLTVRRVVIATAAVTTLTVAGPPWDPQQHIAVAAGNLYVTRGGHNIVVVPAGGGADTSVTSIDEASEHVGYATTAAAGTYVAEARGLAADPAGGRLFFTTSTGVGVLVVG